MKLCTIVGVGPGVSLAVAKRFAAEGYAIALVARNQEKLDRYAAALTHSCPEARGFTADAGDEASLRSAFAAIRGAMGGTDVLVYNAFGMHQGAATDVAAGHLVDDFRVNVVGPQVSVQEVVDAMKKAGRGTILLTGGGLALDPFPPYASLAIGKAGIRSLAFTLAKELEPVGIHVATVTICGMVKDGTHFAAANIAEAFYRLHAQPAGQWEREIVYQ